MLSTVLTRFAILLRQFATTNQSKRVVMEEKEFPYEYGSDLHLLWGWGYRLASLLADDVPPNQYFWMIFLPDEHSRDAMMRFSVKYGHIIEEIKDHLDHAEARFEEFMDDDNETTRSSLVESLQSLSRRIEVGAETIAKNEQTNELAEQQPSPTATQTKEDEPVKLFYSYSHKDEQYREELKTHLAPLRRQKLTEDWHDRKITAGDEWANQISTQLDSADVVLLLISADFIDSDYCHNIEMTRVLERHERNEAVVIPIILRQCHWTILELSKLQALPREAKPVAEWSVRDDAWKNVVQEIERVVRLVRIKHQC